MLKPLNPHCHRHSFIGAPPVENPVVADHYLLIVKSSVVFVSKCVPKGASHCPLPGRDINVLSLYW